uniref:DWF4 n=1 Tax=Arundo donax TaxID=35708 RepID=A0A0A9C0P7_ARUDO
MKLLGVLFFHLQGLNRLGSSYNEESR